MTKGMKKKYFTEEEKRAAHIATQKRYYARHRDKILKYKKLYAEAHQELKKAYNHKYNIENREKVTEYKRVFRKNNKEKVSKMWKRYHEANKEERNARCREYWKTHREQFREYNKKYEDNHKKEISERKQKHYSENKEEMRAKRRVYFKKYYNTPSGRESYRKNARQRRGLGYKPINSFFKGSNYHHLHLIENKSIGLFIPAKLHRSISHNGRTGEGMRNMNKAALLWLCTQSTIVPSEKRR